MTENTQERSSNPFWLVLLALLFIAVTTFAYLQLTREDYFPIKKVNVSGAFKNVNTATVQQIVDKDVSGNFFTLDVTRLYDRLIAEEWVGQVWIHRVWPDQLNIVMQEQVPVAFVEKQGLLNQEGKIFTSNVAAYKKVLPKFEVSDRYYKQAIETYLTLNEILAAYDLSIQTFAFDERKSQVLTLDNGLNIVLGRHETAKRFNRFISAFGHEIEQRKNEIKRVDLRYTNGFAVSSALVLNTAVGKEVV